MIFLRHAQNRFEMAARQIEEDQAAGRMPKRKPVRADYIKRRALFLPETARYDTLLGLETDVDLGEALNEAMEAIEADFEPLRGQLPKDYRLFERDVLEPERGIVFDPACGSGGMFVQTSHFVENHGHDTAHAVTFYGQEKTPSTIPLAKMNLAVHALEGDIREANTFYQDEHALVGKCDFVMASQASSAGNAERDVRRRLVETGDVDVMAAIADSARELLG